MCSTPVVGSANSFSEYFDFSIIYTLSKSPIHLSFKTVVAANTLRPLFESGEPKLQLPAPRN